MADVGTQQTISMQAWASPRLKWFNLVPHKFNQRKADQLQTFVDTLEADGYKILELCKTPFVTAVKIAEYKE